MQKSCPPVPQRWLVLVCQHRTCRRHSASDVLEAFRGYQSNQIRVAEAGCMGQCSSGPTVRIMPDNTWYCRVRPQDVETIVSRHLLHGERVQERLHPRFHPQDQGLDQD